MAILAAVLTLVQGAFAMTNPKTIFPFVNFSVDPNANLQDSAEQATQALSMAIDLCSKAAGYYSEHCPSENAEIKSQQAFGILYLLDSAQNYLCLWLSASLQDSNEVSSTFSDPVSMKVSIKASRATVLSDAEMGALCYLDSALSLTQLFNVSHCDESPELGACDFLLALAKAAFKQASEGNSGAPLEATG
ncbi:MAG: hypothetical protein OIF38_06155 [Cellvibrionaceae bacterium]|nr:hypothetical protein [Cellvibrionaceae bacterium]